MTSLLLLVAPPDDADVKAGWPAFLIVMALALAVALLGWSLVKQLKKAQAAKDAGVYGDEPVRDPGDATPDE